MSEQPEGNAFQGTQPDLSRSDVRPLIRAQLKELQADVASASRRIDHRVSSAHLEDVLARIEVTLEAQEG